MKVLLVESEANYSAWLVEKLRQSGFRMELCDPGGMGRSAPAPKGHSATIIDIAREGPCPSHLVKRFRDSGQDGPIMVISEQENWREKVQSMDAGADDFVVKPVRSEEISARLRALIRRSAGQTSDLLSRDGIELNLKQNHATLDGQLLDLTRNELRLLRQMLLWPERTHTAGDILALVQQGDCRASTNAVEVLVARLRKKIGRERIRTIRGVGYRLADRPDESMQPQVMLRSA